jgi:cellulose synthase/poly-beta-1,6-N-acetylglucosamine synthase-like glycosyltransferase
MRINFHSQNRTIALAILSLPLGFRSNQFFRSLDRLPADSRIPELPSLSIVIPSRNEEENLKRLLPSLLQVEYPGELEIIVVNDNSYDQTAAVARKHEAMVVDVAEPPANCRGKQNASHHGACAATNEWILFTDADTYHFPKGPAEAVNFALNHNLDVLSLFPEQKFHSVIDHLVVTCAFASLFAGQHCEHILINGQFILIKKDVYIESGGFMAVADQMQDDLAFGYHLAKEGYKLGVLDGANAESVYMYKDTAHMWRGISRLSAGSLKWSGWRAMLTMIYATSLAAPFLAFLGFLRGRIRLPWVILSWAAASFSIFPWSRRLGSSWYSLLAPIGALIMLQAAIWGHANRIVGNQINWKGRRF